MPWNWSGIDNYVFIDSSRGNRPVRCTIHHTGVSVAVQVSGELVESPLPVFESLTEAVSHANAVLIANGINPLG